MERKEHTSSPDVARPFFVNAGDPRTGDPLKFMGIHPNEIKISRHDTGGALALFEYIGHDKVGPPLHVHHAQDEIFYVVEGEYRFVAGDETRVVKAGDTIFLPRTVPHTWVQLTDRGKLIYLVTPAQELEDFFTHMNGLREVPSIEELNRIHNRHDMQVLGPPLTL